MDLTLGAATYHNILNSVPAEVKEALSSLPHEGAFTWVRRAEMLAEALVARNDKLIQMEAEMVKMKESLLRFKDAIVSAGSDADSSPTSPNPTGILAEVSSLSKNPQSSLRLLLVEDDTFQAAALGEMCASNGYDTSVAHSGEEALEILKKDAHFNLVLCDVLMPGITGVKVLTWIRENMKETDPTVIMISSNDNVELVEKCILHGADSYMLKPATSREVSALWHLVARRQQDLARRQAVQDRVSWKADDLRECIQMIEDSIGAGNKSSKSNEPSSTPSSKLNSFRKSNSSSKLATGGEEGEEEWGESEGDLPPATPLKLDMKRDLASVLQYTLVAKMPGKGGVTKTVRLLPVHDEVDEHIREAVEEGLYQNLEETADAMMDSWSCCRVLGFGVVPSTRSRSLYSHARWIVTSPYQSQLLFLRQGKKSRRKKRGQGLTPPGRSLSNTAQRGRTSASPLSRDLAVSPWEDFASRSNSSGLRRSPHTPERRSLSRSMGVGRTREMLHEELTSSSDEENELNLPESELVVCRLCETKARAHLLIVLVVHENADSDKELAHLLNMIDQSNRKLLVDLLTVALRRHSLLCYPLELLASICQCATLDKLTNVSPLSVVRPLQSSHPTTLSTHLSTHLTSRQRRSPRCFTLTAQ
ncbi:MAG: hypothetical protein SGPRY_002068 [Prymnesium sp.]